MSRRILALDQSSRTSGYAIFVEGRLETFGHFTIKDEDIIRELMELEITTLTPLDALNTLYQLQNKLKNRWKN